MNIFVRIIRLPFVAKASPILNLGVWAVVTLIGFRSSVDAGLPLLPPGQLVADTVQPFTPFDLAASLIKRFVRSKDVADTRFEFISKTSYSLVKFLFKAITQETTAAIADNRMPSIVAGKIDSRHIVNNMQGKTFIIGISDDVINYLGFLLITLRAILVGIGVILVMKLLYHRYLKPILIQAFREVEGADVAEMEAIDVEHHDTAKPPFLKKYLKKNKC